MISRKTIEKRLAEGEKRLANAEKYVARNLNVESSSWYHFADWWGNSGHPLWMKNHMIPTVKKVRAQLEQALDRIHQKAKDKKLILRKRRCDERGSK
jgi:hypothetical protein